MIDIQNIEFEEKRVPWRWGEEIRVNAKLQLQATVSTTSHTNVPMQVINRELAERVWWQAYGDIIPLIEELKVIAMLRATPDHLDRAQEIGGQLSRFLEMPLLKPRMNTKRHE